MAHYVFNFTRKNAAKGRSLRDQAAELLRVGLWGIGARTPNRDLLQPGDRVLVFVGSPEQEFVGHALLSTDVHEWTAAEKARYPGSWSSGVAFSEAEVWEHPLGLMSVWPGTSAATNNPRGLFFAGVQGIVGEDFETILAGRRSKASSKSAVDKRAATQSAISRAGSARRAPPLPVPSPASTGGRLLDVVYSEAERLKAYISSSNAKVTSEAATRALFINRLLEALGYVEFGDVEYDAPVDSGDFADYVLHADDRAVAIVEAKRLGAPLGSKEAAQVVKYASVLGVRWGLLTDGRIIRLYDPRIPQVSPESRLVFELDLAGYADKEDFAVRLYPELELLSRSRIADEAGLEQRAAREAVRELLTSPESNSVRALRDELRQRKLIQLSQEQITELLDAMLG